MNKKENKKILSEKAQSIIEYLLLMAVVIVLLMVFFGSGGYFQEAYNRTLLQQGNDMLEAVAVIFR